MTISVIELSANTPEWLSQGILTYQKRLTRWPVSLIQLAPIKRAKHLPISRIQGLEAEKLRQACPKGARVCLDESAPVLTSREFAVKIDQWHQHFHQIAFLIGGPDGHHPDSFQHCQFSLSLGSMTWPHALVKLLLLEQLYRCQCILTGHPYHRD